jgi:hypothetical protein
VAVSAFMCARDAEPLYALIGISMKDNLPFVLVARSDRIWLAI